VAQHLEKNRRIIEDYEFSFARRLAKGVIEKPKISVWLVFLPILFVHYAQRIRQYKTGLQQFCDGILHTRKFALAAVVDDLQGTSAAPDYRESFLRAHPASGEEVQAVLQLQLAEMALLREHYQRLLVVRAVNDYGVMVQRAYGTEAGYRDFLERLERVEEEVRLAVLKAFQPDQEAGEVSARMAKLTRDLRQEEIRFIFP
jgi:hypothetical protein